MNPWDSAIQRYHASCHFADDQTVELLSTHLEAFVPIEIKELERQGGVTSWHIEEAQRRIATIRASGESEALFYAFDNAKTRRTMGILVECLAVLAFNPGGITAYGCHFEAVESQWIMSEEQCQLKELIQGK